MSCRIQTQRRSAAPLASNTAALGDCLYATAQRPSTVPTCRLPLARHVAPRRRRAARSAGTPAAGSPGIAIWLLIDLSPAVSFSSDAIRGGVVAFCKSAAGPSSSTVSSATTDPAGEGASQIRRRWIRERNGRCSASPATRSRRPSRPSRRPGAGAPIRPRSVVMVAGLARPAFLVEIDAIAGCELGPSSVVPPRGPAPRRAIEASFAPGRGVLSRRPPTSSGRDGRGQPRRPP
jgi:hypothetical protein